MTAVGDLRHHRSLLPVGCRLPRTLVSMIRNQGAFELQWGTASPWENGPERHKTLHRLKWDTKEATHITHLEGAVHFRKSSGAHTNGLAQIDPRIIVLLGVVANCGAPKWPTSHSLAYWASELVYIKTLNSFIHALSDHGVPDLSILPQESDIPQEFDALSDQAAHIARLERLHVEQDHINIAQAAEMQCLNAQLQRLISQSTPGKYYAVARGRETGIFDNWPRAHTATRTYSGACFLG